MYNSVPTTRFGRFLIGHHQVGYNVRGTTYLLKYSHWWQCECSVRGGEQDLVYNSRACIVCSLLVGCVFPSGVIGVRGWPGCHNGLLLWPCGHPTWMNWQPQVGGVVVRLSETGIQYICLWGFI